MDLDHVVEHAREHLDDLAKLLPIETGVLAEGIAHETAEIDGAEETGTIGGQGLLAARVGRPDVLAEPVIVPLVNAVEEDESGLGIVIRRGHDHVPQVPRAQGLVDLAGDLALGVDEVAFMGRPVPPHHRRRIIEIDGAVGLRHGQREGERPYPVVFDGVHELVGDEQQQVELTEPRVLALGADEVLDVGVADIEGGHLRPAPPAGRGHREAHLVVDIHE